MTVRLTRGQAEQVAASVRDGLENGLDRETRERVADTVNRRGAPYLVRVFGTLPVDPQTGRIAVRFRDVLTIGALLNLEDELRRPVSGLELVP